MINWYHRISDAKCEVPHKPMSLHPGSTALVANIRNDTGTVMCTARHTSPIWRMLVKHKINNLLFCNICSFNTFERIYAITKVQSSRPFKRKKREKLLSHAVLQQACP